MGPPVIGDHRAPQTSGPYALRCPFPPLATPLVLPIRKKKEKKKKIYFNHINFLKLRV